jgi:hypothetical protein
MYFAERGLSGYDEMVFYQLVAGKMWQPPTTGTVAGMALRRPLDVNSTGADGAIVAPHEESTASLRRA